MADAVRGKDEELISERDRWLILLREPEFRARVIELAWIQLEGSLPEDEAADQLDDWI